VHFKQGDLTWVTLCPQSAIRLRWGSSECFNLRRISIKQLKNWPVRWVVTVQQSFDICNLWVRSKSWEYGCRTFWLKTTRISMLPSVLLSSPIIGFLINNINLCCPALSLAMKNGASVSISSKGKNYMHVQLPSQVQPYLYVYILFYGTTCFGWWWRQAETCSTVK
jgi:hypothetical protein